MFDQPLDRVISWRLGLVSDLDGRRRPIRRGTRGGIWFIDPTFLDESAEADSPNNADSRPSVLEAMRESGLFTDVELRTLRALALERLTIAEIAARDGCSRQAVLARLTGNSKGQGGILRKARRFQADLASPTSRVSPS